VVFWLTASGTFGGGPKILEVYPISSSITPVTFIELDIGNEPDCLSDSPVSVAIDSDDRLHIVYVAGAASAEDLDYVTFDTVDSTAGDDSYNTPEEAISMEDADNDYYCCAVAIDSNDIPHATVIGSDADMGTDYDTIYYDNRIGGSWADRRIIEGEPTTKNCSYHDLAINSDNYPVIVYHNNTDDTLDAVEGDANDPASFATREVDASCTSSPGAGRPTICVDSNGDAWVAYVDADGTLGIGKQSANWTDAWTIANSGNNATVPSIMADGTDIYVLYEEGALHDIVYDKYTGSWLGETSLNSHASEPYANAKARWSYLNNPAYATYGIDYVYEDSAYVYWDNLSLVEYVPQIMMII
jgi:hypothetical protein